MLVHTLRRLLTILPVMWAAATLTFFGVHLAPGDPATAQLAQSGASAAAITERRTALGLDEPVEIQYYLYLTGLLRGDLGRSWRSNRPVSRIIGEAFPSTITLALAASVVSVLIGLSLGSIAAIARHRRRWAGLDSACMLVALGGLSTPVAFSGLVAILIFSLTLEWLPATGQGGLRHLLLPAMVLGWAGSGSLARLTRDRLLAVLDQPYIMAGRARGIPGRRLLRRHSARVALPDVLTVLALQIGFLLAGTVITESVFARRGLGRVAVDAVLNQDLPVVQGVVLLAALVYALSNLVADSARFRLDPRLQEGAKWR
jgi:ABC-type dipeptide/oligopeptide/nickel transport system permease component